MGILRNFPCSAKADLHIDLSPGTRYGSGIRANSWKTLDRRMVRYRPDVFSALLDASRLAAARVGTLRRCHWNASSRHPQLLDEWLLEFFDCSFWRFAVARRFAANQKTFAN